MDWRSFIAAFVDSIAWPVAIVVVAFILRSQVTELLLRVRRIKHGGTEVDFDSAVFEVTRQAQKALPDQLGDTHTAAKRLTMLAELSPRGAILEAWLDVEQALGCLGRRYGVSEEEGKSLGINMLRLYLSESGAPIGQGAIELLGKLRQLRNQAVHMDEAEIDPTTAREYILLAERMTKLLNEA